MSFDPKMLRIIRQRQPQKLTQNDVAKGAGFSRTNYAKKESGDIPLTVDDLQKLSRFYGINITEFFPSENEEIPDNTKKENNVVILEMMSLIKILHRKIDERDERIKYLEAKLDKINQG